MVLAAIAAAQQVLSEYGPKSPHTLRLWRTRQNEAVRDWDWDWELVIEFSAELLKIDRCPVKKKTTSGYSLSKRACGQVLVVPVNDRIKQLAYVKMYYPTN